MITEKARPDVTPHSVLVRHSVLDEPAPYLIRGNPVWFPWIPASAAIQGVGFSSGSFSAALNARLHLSVARHGVTDKVRGVVGPHCLVVNLIITPEYPPKSSDMPITASPPNSAAFCLSRLLTSVPERSPVANPTMGM